MSQKRMLVTDGETRAALAVTRGLADAGFEVAAAAHARPAAAHWSRSVTQRIPMPDPLTEEAGFLAALERTLRDGDFGVLLPGSDASLLSVSGARHRLDPHVRIGLPAHEIVQRSLDKTDLVLTAACHALDSPTTVICHSSWQALEAAREIGFPVVVKPLSSIIGDKARRRRSGSVLAADAAGLRGAMTSFGGSGMVQRHVRGSVVSFAGVFAGGRLLAEAVSRYHRTWHPTAGNACYSETIEAPPVLHERVAALLDDLGWEGLFELELIDRGDGTWHAIDFNPRAYGSLALAIGAGANLPAIWCRHLLGSDAAPVKAVPGVFYRWTEADVRHAFWQLRNGRGAAAAGVLNLHRGVVHPYVRSGDLGPGVARLLELGTKAVKRGRTSRGEAPDRSPTVIIGAGPNGLAAASHLRHAGIDVRCFGEPLGAWSHQMPAGMLLRSRRRSSNIADPQRALTIDDYERDDGRRLGQPHLKVEEFIDYGRWFQQRAVPDLDRRKVTEVARLNGGFRVRLDDGEELRASRVIVAAGLSPFLHRPSPFAALPRSVCSHAYEHNDLGGFAGRRVAAVGSGQSALECAALLNEAGASVEVLARAEAIYWLGDGTGDAASAADGDAASAADRRLRGLLISPPPTDVGGRATGWIAAAPDLFRKVPRALHPTISFRCIRPAGAGWLRPRLADVPISLGCRVIQAEVQGDAVELRLTDGSKRRVDHVLLGTGYRIDVRRYPFLSPELAADLALADGYPVLGPGLESSVAGLHFMGAPAAYSFGPIMRFVVGTWYAAPAVARRASHRRQPPVSFSF